MYVGTTRELGRTLVEGLLADVLQQALAGRARRLDVAMRPGGTVVVADDGPGLPPELVTAIFSGQPWPQERPAGPPVPSRGPWSAVIAALSSRLGVTTTRDGRTARQTFSRGAPMTPLVVEPANAPSGTCVELTPDAAIAPDVRRLGQAELRRRLRELAACCPSLRVTLRVADRRPERLRMAHGVADLLRPSWSPALRRPARHQVVGCHGVSVDVALTWAARGARRPRGVRGWVNSIQMTDGGSYERGLLRALRRALPEVREPERDVLAAVSVIHPAPIVRGSSWTSLENPEVAAVVAEAVLTALGALPPAERDGLVTWLSR